MEVTKAEVESISLQILIGASLATAKEFFVFHFSEVK